MMADLGLVIVGSSPSGFNSAPSTPTRQYNKTFTKHSLTYADRLFGETPSQQVSRPPSARSSARSASGQNDKNNERSTAKNKKNRHNESYVDELLFGPKPVEPGFKSPWEKPSKKPVIFDMTDYKKMKPKKASEQESSHLNTRKPLKAKHNPSFFDKGFSQNNKEDRSFSSPWNRGSRQDLAHDNDTDGLLNGLEGTRAGTPTNSRPPSRDGGRPESGRSSYRSSSSRPQTPNKKNKNKVKDLHQKSFVDEMLFGPKPTEPSFAAPWEKKEKKQRPFFCDSSSSSYTIEHGQAGERPRSASHSRPSSAGSTQSKPVWK